MRRTGALQCNSRRRCLHLLLVALLAAPVALSQATTPLNVEGRLVVLAEPRNKRGGAAGPVALAVRLTAPAALAGQLYSLRFPQSVAAPASYATGDLLSFTLSPARSGPLPGVSPPGGGPPGSLWATAWAPIAEAFPKELPSWEAPVLLRSVTFVVTEVCGAAAALSAADVSEVYFGSPGAGLIRKRPPGATLERQWDACSGGGYLVKAALNAVVNVTLPCAGVRANGAAFNASGGACGANEWWGWMEAAINATRQAYGIDASVGPLRRLLLLPPGLDACTWQRRAARGCDRALGCDAWVKAVRRPQLLEGVTAALGHTLGLGHAIAPLNAAANASDTGGGPPAGGDPWPAGWGAADVSDPLGAMDGGARCFNAPHSWLMGVAGFAASAYARLQPFGPSAPLQLPGAASAPTGLNTLRLVPDGFTGPQPPAALVDTLFVQYRTPLGGDAGLLAPARGRLLVHAMAARYDGDPSYPYGTAPPPTRLLAALAPGEAYDYAADKLIVRFVSTAQQAASPEGDLLEAAVVRYCRYLPDMDPEEFCPGFLPPPAARRRA